MNWLDFALVLIIVISIVSGWFAGFARTGVGFLASILGLVLGLQYYRTVGFALRSHIHESSVANITGFLIVYFGIVLLGALASRLLARFVRAADLYWLDSLLGGALGVVRGGLFAVIAIWGLMAFAPVPPRMILSSSRVAPCVMDAARRVADASPDEVRLTFRRSYRELSRELNKVLPEGVKDRLSNLAPSQI
jgi:membrane protein required for colicin V production